MNFEMDDVFIEYRVMKKRDKSDKAKIALVTVAAAFVFLIFLACGVLITSFFVLLDIGVIYGWWFLLTLFNVEYEYALTNGEIDIDKITAKRKRKRLITVDLRKIDLLAPVSGAGHKREFESPDFRTKIDAASSPESPNAYFMVFSHPKSGYTRVIFEPDSRMLESAKMFCPRKFFDK